MVRKPTTMSTPRSERKQRTEAILCASVIILACNVCMILIWLELDDHVPIGPLCNTYTGYLQECLQHLILLVLCIEELHCLKLGSEVIHQIKACNVVCL